MTQKLISKIRARINRGKTKMNEFEKERNFQNKRLLDEIIPKYKEDLQNAINYCNAKIPKQDTIRGFYSRLLREVEDMEKMLNGWVE